LNAYMCSLSFARARDGMLRCGSFAKGTHGLNLVQGIDGPFAVNTVRKLKLDELVRVPLEWCACEGSW
jgi:hypothetical protein